MKDETQMSRETDVLEDKVGEIYEAQFNLFTRPNQGCDVKHCKECILRKRTRTFKSPNRMTCATLHVSYMVRIGRFSIPLFLGRKRNTIHSIF